MAAANGVNGHDGLHLMNRLGESRSPYVSPTLLILDAGPRRINFGTDVSGNGRSGST